MMRRRWMKGAHERPDGKRPHPPRMSKTEGKHQKDRGGEILCGLEGWRPSAIQKRMARPVCKGFLPRLRLISLLQRIRPRGASSGQDGDTRAPVLIKASASNAVF